MARNNIQRIAHGAVCLLMMGLWSCRHEPMIPKTDDLAINLIWYHSYETETAQAVDTGLMWTLSFLGAAWPEGSYSNTVHWDGDTLRMNLTHAGFDAQATRALKRLLEVFKATEEYRLRGGFDVGRFVALLLLSSDHYYGLTGMPATLEAFIDSRPFRDQKVALMRSTVSTDERLIRVPAPGEDAFIAMEGSFDSASATMAIQEYEVMDVMPNGQLRFGVYDAEGQRVPFADPALSQGGKPSKCLWCHETNINRNFNQSPSHPQFHSVEWFNALVDSMQSDLHAQRLALNTDLDYSRRQNHTHAELLYIGFMEPNARRLALEWDMPESAVQARLSGISTHDHHEFAFLKQCYNRREVDAHSPLTVIPVSDDAREPGNAEPNLLP